MSNIHEVNVTDENLYLELWQYDAGQKLKFVETSIADGSHVLFANSETRKAIRKEVANNEVGIPNKFLRATGKMHITIETLNENEETTLYEINGYIKRRQDGEPGTVPEDEPTFIQKIIKAIEELQDKVANWFYTKGEVDDKDTETLNNAKNYTNDVREDLEDEIESKVPLTRKLGEDLTLNIDIDGYRFAGALIDALVDDSSSQFSKFINRLKDFFYAEDEIDQELSSLGNSLSVSIDPLTYVCTFRLMHNSRMISVSSIDLPLETMVVDADYDSQTKEIVLTLQSGSTVRFSVADLVSGLVTESDFQDEIQGIQDALDTKQDKITSQNKLDADFIGNGNTNKVVTQSEKDAWNGKQDALSGSDTVHINNGVLSATEPKYELIKTIDISQLSEPVSMLIIDQDEQGNAFSYDDIYVEIAQAKTSAANSKVAIDSYTNGTTNAVTTFSKANALNTNAKSVFYDISRKTEKAFYGALGGFYNNEVKYEARISAMAYTNKINKVQIYTDTTFTAGILKVYGRRKY